MDKLLEYGRKAMFYIRVLSGYEERRIRSYRMQLQKRLEHAEQKKMELRKLPEQVILGEVRRMVEEMQHLNKKLEETETAIEEYFKPIDMQAGKIMEMQLKEEERTMKEMVKAMQREALVQEQEALVQEAEVERSAKVNSMDQFKHKKDLMPTTAHQA